MGVCGSVASSPIVHVYMHLITATLVLFPRRIRNRLIFTKENDITLNFPVVQMQRGSSDYRSFAAAFATSLFCGLNPAHAGAVHTKNVPGPSYGMTTERSHWCCICCAFVTIVSLLQVDVFSDVRCI